MINYIDLLSETIRRDWDSLALCDWHGEQFTFSQLAGNIERLHLLFDKTGVSEGDKITIYAPNSAR